MRRSTAPSRKRQKVNDEQQPEFENHNCVLRAPILSCLTVDQKLLQPFKPPCPSRRSFHSDVLLKRKTLGLRLPLQAMNSDCSSVFRKAVIAETIDFGGITPEEREKLNKLPPYIPLVLYSGDYTEVTVPEIVGRFLRPHQREGLAFLFNCVAGITSSGNETGSTTTMTTEKTDAAISVEEEGFFGCLLADDMGLGKTLQSIALIYTLSVTSYLEFNKAMVVCPTSLVSNWDNEVRKWVGDRLYVVPLTESNRSDVIKSIERYKRSKLKTVLIISYDTFRLHCDRFPRDKNGELLVCDLLVCDEAHRLKNDQTLTNQSLAQLKCKRRILLSGTPMQNDLGEFYSMVQFTNPGILGTSSSFRRKYQMPITVGREPFASDQERKLGEHRSQELSNIVNEFILRRTNTLLSKHLPPKYTSIVCCRPSDIQREIYEHFLKSKEMRYLLEKKHSKVLSSITSIKKLCNHPQLVKNAIIDAHRKHADGGSSDAAILANGFGDCMCFFDEAVFNPKVFNPALGGKMGVLIRLLENLRGCTKDRIVVVSNYTETLELIHKTCRNNRWPCVRLDGSTSASKRGKIVDSFNDPIIDQFVFLLSSKAGGCGLNLIGANRLLLFDPDWNPATDKQAAARVWREGQKKTTFVYRFLTTGTIEEKIFQRQIKKEALQSLIGVADEEKQDAMSTDDLKNLFQLQPSYGPAGGCDTYDMIVSGTKEKIPKYTQDSNAVEEDLTTWEHHFQVETLKSDPILQMSAKGQIDFVFNLLIDKT